MSGVRVLVGTRKGAFVLSSDGRRERWDVSGPHFGGWEMYHLKGSPADPNRIYASQSSGWFGQIVQRSNDGGKTWETVGNKFVYDGVPGTHQWYDGTPHPWEFKRVWHLEPSLTDPDTVYAGVEDAALFRSTDGGQSWAELPGLRGHASGSAWAPGAGGLCLHTIVIDPSNHQRMFIAISAAGAFRTEDAGQTWQPINRGLKSEGIPNPEAEVGHCVHRIAMHPSCPDQERFRALPARWQVARVPQSHRRQRVGGAHEWVAAARLLRQRASRCDVRRFARPMRRVLRHHGRPGVRVRERRGHVGPDRQRSSGRRVGRSPDAAMIRIVLPAHLRTLAQVDDEVRLELEGDVTVGSVLDALEARYPVLRGTIRDHVTLRRRPFVRFYACEEDLSHEGPGAPLPDAVVSGAEPFLVVGAMAGG
jgi:hypothetical protein